MARSLGVEPRILDAVDLVNTHQKKTLVHKIEQHFANGVTGKTFAIWGLAFKPKTDDIREAPALVVIDYLLSHGAKVRVSDPEANENVRKDYGDKLSYFTQPMEALAGADALVINTEWQEFRNPSFSDMRKRLASPVVFDGRNLYDPVDMVKHGFTYYSIGRVTASPKK